MNSIKINHGKTLMIAHRGLSGLEKENTIPSFVAAGQHTYYGMECDIHPTTDNVLVVIHDSNTQRVSGDDIVVEKVDYETVKNIELLDKYQNVKRSVLRIPLFVDYLETCIRYEKTAVVELKEVFDIKNVEQTLNIVKEYNYLEHTVFISFYPQNILNLLKLEPKCEVQLLATDLRQEILDGCFTYHLNVDVNYRAITSKEIIDEFHEKGLKVNVWTVDDKEVAEKLCDWGIDFITTNILE